MDYCSGGDLSYYIKNRGRLPSLDFVPRGGGKAVFWPHPEEGGLDEVVVRSFLAQLGQYARSLSFIASSGPLKQWSSISAFSSGAQVSAFAKPDSPGHQASGECSTTTRRPVTLESKSTYPSLTRHDPVPIAV